MTLREHIERAAEFTREHCDETDQDARLYYFVGVLTGRAGFEWDEFRELVELYPAESQARGSAARSTQNRKGETS